MPERSAVAERYRPARLTKMPRNRADKKDLDVRIGSANLPVSQPLMLNTESAAFAIGEEEKDDDSAPHTVAKRQPCCRTDPSCRCGNALLTNVEHSLQGRSGLSDLAVNRTLMPSRRCD